MFATPLAGCGGDGGDQPSKELQGLRIEQFQFDVRFFCTSGRHDLYGAADPLGTVLTAVDNLIKTYREDPDATYKLALVDPITGMKAGTEAGLREVPIRKLLEQSASTLGKKCGGYGRDQERRLRAALRS